MHGLAAPVRVSVRGQQHGPAVEVKKPARLARSSMLA
jgi:hypothetical protein